ncbi:MAG: hypothetical protein HY964_05325 [Ignavibacteriales bacterium]|nr:hypothetical protein [Ignavibacteriales bacterium]
MIKEQKKKIPLEKYILEKLNGMESRLINKIDDTSVNFKEYVDSGISPIQTQISSLQQQTASLQHQMLVMQGEISEIRIDVKKLDKKLDVRTDGLVKLIETRVGEIIDLDKRVTILESRKN